MKTWVYFSKSIILFLMVKTYMSQVKSYLALLLFLFLFVSHSFSENGNLHSLVFLNQPETVVAGPAIEPPIQVAVQDSDGNIVTSAQNLIKISIQSETEGVELLGTTNVQAMNGIATFEDVRVNQAGEEFRLVAYQPVQLLGHWQEESNSNKNAGLDFGALDDEKEDESSIIYTDVWGEGNLAFIGRTSDASGVEIIDISNPETPVRIAHWESESGGNNILDVKVQNGIAYLVSGNGGGVFVLDVREPGNPVLISEIDENNNSFKTPHNLFVLNDYLYICDGRTRDVKVFDVSDPTVPQFVSNSSADSGEPVHDITAHGDRLYFSTIGFTGYTEIYDISNVESGIPLLGSFASGRSTHSNWPTEDGDYIAVAQERSQGKLQIWDIRDYENVEKASDVQFVTFEGDPYSPHNPLIDGDTLYVAWYAAGLQVFDIQNPSNPRLMGFYDTKPGYPDERFIGAWGVYPFLGEERILLSDVETGLYIFDASELNSEVGISQPFDVLESTGMKEDEWLRMDTHGRN